MNADRMLALYDRIADSPIAVERLRQFILDLAMRGKLVAQNPEGGSLRHTTRWSSALTENQPYQIPASWHWTQLGAIGSWGSGSTPARNNPAFYGGDVTWLKSGELNDNRRLAGSEEKITPLALEKNTFRRNRPGDVLIAMYGATIGKVAILAESAVTNQAVCGCTPSSDVYNEFLFFFLQSWRARFHSASEGGAQPNISKAKIVQTPFPQAPLEEQHRIVAKVDELMALCDQLEKARADRETQRDKLTASTLARLNAPNPETFHDDARFTLSNLHALTARRDQIKHLRQTIVNLAMRGHLVPAASGTARGRSATRPENRSEIPSGWQHLPLGQLLSEDTRNGYSKRPDDAKDGVPILRISAGTARRDGIVAEEEHKRISGIDAKVREQYGLHPGDLLACRFNGNKEFVGRLTLFKDYLGLRPIYPDKLIRVRPDPGIALPSFLRLAGDSDRVRAEIERFCATTVGNWGISASNLKEVRFPVPPLTEQELIVDKVDELMRLCDQLENTLTTGDETRRHLLEAVLSEALQSGDKGSDARAGQRPNSRSVA